MMLCWKNRYFDRNEECFEDRELFLDTESLCPADRAALELIIEIDGSQKKREVLKFRDRFRDQEPDVPDRAVPSNEFRSFILPHYFEDEKGDEIEENELIDLLTQGELPEAGPPPPVPVAEVALTTDEVRLLAYFLRDHKELAASALMKEGPGTLHSPGELTPPGFKKYSFKTALTDDEIRSTVTIYRRLYMQNEPANVEKAAVLFSGKLNAHPYAQMGASFAVEYRKRLDSPPSVPMLMPGKVFTFKTKQLIDIFLYTQYHHQPKKSQELQFAEYLREVHGERDVLMCLFLWSLWETSIHIQNVGSWIDLWFQHYCSYHKITPEFLDSLRNQGVGIGALEKEDDRKARLLREKAERLAAELWEKAGRPPGGPSPFLQPAREQLEQALRGERQP